MSEETSAFGKTRRRFLTTAGATGALALAGCVGGDDDDVADDSDDTVADDSDDTVADDSDDGAATEPDEPTEIDWVMNPAEETIDIEIQYDPLFEYIESEADVVINGLPTSSYAATVEELVRASDGDAVFADTSPGAVVQEPDDIDVVGMREAFGSEQYFGILVTLADSGIEEIADLEGEAIATAGATSVSGGFVPLLLLQEGGLDIGGAPAGEPEDFDWRPEDHATAVEQLIQDDSIMAAGCGEFAAAAHVPPEQFDEMEPEFGEISPDYPADGVEREPEFRLLGISDPIPRAPIVANAQWDDPVRDEVEELMLGAEPEDMEHDTFQLASDLALALSDETLEAYDAGELDTDELSDDEVAEVELLEDHELWFSGVVEATHEDYEPINELLSALGLDPEEVE